MSNFALLLVAVSFAAFPATRYTSFNCQQNLFTGTKEMSKYVYFFGGKSADGNGKMKELLGGKGANLAEMCLVGIPVPPGFTITTEVCAAYYEQGKKIPEAAIPE